MQNKMIKINVEVEIPRAEANQGCYGCPYYDTFIRRKIPFCLLYLKFLSDGNRIEDCRKKAILAQEAGKDNDN